MLGRVDLHDDEISYRLQSMRRAELSSKDVFPLSLLTLDVLDDLPIADRLRSHSLLVAGAAGTTMMTTTMTMPSRRREDEC